MHCQSKPVCPTKKFALVCPGSFLTPLTSTPRKGGYRLQRRQSSNDRSCVSEPLEPVTMSAAVAQHHGRLTDADCPQSDCVLSKACAAAATSGSILIFSSAGYSNAMWCQALPAQARMAFR